MRNAVVTILLLTVTWTEARDGVFPDWNTLVLDSYQFKSMITLKPNDADPRASSTSGYVDEYVDMTEDIGRLEVTQGPDKMSIFYNRELKEVTVVSKSGSKVDCAVAPWNEKNEILKSILVWGWEDTYDRKQAGVVFGPSAIFHILRNEGYPVKFERLTTVRGIKAIEYSAKINQFPNVTYTLHMTMENWTNPYTGLQGKQIPVRITANGLDGKNMVSYVVDITNFRSYVDMSALELPVGIGCPGMNSTMPIPELPGSFAFVSEVYNLTRDEEEVENFINLHKVWFIGDSKYSRIEMYDKGKSGAVEIHDFNTGVLYSFDDKDQCKIQPLITSAFEKNHNLVRVMKNPNDIFHLDNSTYYLGKAFTRGINCDVYETVVFDFDKGEESSTISKMVFTIYFTTYNWIDVVDGKQENQVPVKLLITAYNKDMSLYYKLEHNIFNFAEQFGSDTMKYFNVEKCFPQPTERQYIQFKIIDDRDTAKIAETNNADVRSAIFSNIVILTSISPLRIPYIRVDYEENNILARALILERTPALKSFQLLFQDMTVKSKEIQVTLKSPSTELCAQECLKLEDSSCRSFHFCQGDCFLSTFSLLDDMDKWGDPLTNFSHCEFYRKAEFDETGFQPSLDEALKTIEKSVKMGEFLIPVRDKKNKREFVLNATSVSRINPFTSLDKDHGKFEIMWPSKTLPSSSDDETVVDGLSANTRFDCYRRCDAEKSISCVTFSFCEDTMECRLSSKNWTSTSLSINTQCKFFTVSAITLFDKIEGKVAASHGDEYVTALNPEQCAQKCRAKRNSLPCRGFEYCEKLKSCVMHKKHYLDINPKDIINSEIRCDHYALKFSQDFVPTGRLFIKDDKSQVIEQIGEEECAKRCSEKPGDACKSFTFCGDKEDDTLAASKCELYTKSLFDDKVETTNADDNCQIYTRNDNAIFQDKQAQLQFMTSGYTPGTLTGLIFGMLFLGLALGAAAFLGYSYYRSRRNDDGMTVRFAKSDT